MESATVEHLLTKQPTLVVPPVTWSEDTRKLVIERTIELASRLGGSQVGDELRRVGLSKLHKVLPVEQLGPLNDLLQDSDLPQELYRWACKAAREHLKVQGDFFLDEKIYFRINYPFDVATKSKSNRKTPRKKVLRVLREPRLAVDYIKNLLVGKGFRPTLDLEGYNRNRPRETWAHGPHIDTWYGHAYGSINYWWSITGVNEENSMVLYPEGHKRSLPFDPSSMYLKPGVRTPPPNKLTLKDGELLIFDAELLHSTRINTSDETRYVITLRINPGVPRFAPSSHLTHYNWHRASAIDSGVFQTERVGKLVQIDPYPKWEGTAAPRRQIAESFTTRKAFDLGAASDFTEPMTVLQFDNIELIVLRKDNELSCVHGTCPHVGMPLADGHIIDGQLQCPAHGLRFDTKTGATHCSLKLKTYPLSTVEGRIVLNPTPSSANQAESEAAAAS